MMLQDFIEMDDWAGRGGGKRAMYGPNSALAHYVGKLPINDVVCLHKTFSPEADFTLFAMKALSKVMCVATIAHTANVVYFVKKTLALSIFGSGIRGKVLTSIAIGEALGEDNPKDIAERILMGELPLAKKRRTQKIVKRLRPDPV